MSSTVVLTPVYNLILEIRQVDRKFRRALKQIVLLNNRIDSMLVHYNRSGRDNQRSHRYARRLQLATMEGVRNLYYQYAREQCAVMDDLQVALKELTGSEYDDFEEFE